MAIVNPNNGRQGALIRQIIADRKFRGEATPSAQPGAPLRELVQQPQLQPEAPGSARVAAVKPLLGEEAAAAVPPTPEVPGGVATPGTTPVAPRSDVITSSTPGGPVAPSAPSSVPGAPSPAIAPPATPQARGVAVRGASLSLPTRIAPSRTRVTPRFIITPKNQPERGKKYPRPTPFPTGTTG